MTKENLVIVESPAKAKTIEKILGSDYTVKSSYGHIRDLAKSGLGIDIEAGFVPQYEVSADKQAIVKELKTLAKSAKTVWLASDEDREGEAIAWHLEQTLNLPSDKVQRIVFHEITPTAIKAAIANPRQVDGALVDAQQARRVLDRLVGFELSPVLWKKVKPQLSAGRVQSVAVKLIVESEREIQKFESKPYFRLTGEFKTSENKKFKAEVKERCDNLDQAQEVLAQLSGASFKVENLQTVPAKRSPAAPFTTSTLQQEASRKLGFSVGMTMNVAQKLYEAGYITYMRTDSYNLSKEALVAAGDVIANEFGEKYHRPRTYTTKSKGAQEAHEAIRPTNLKQKSIEGTPQQKKLYELIWRRTVATQMEDAVLERTTVTLSNDKSVVKFVANGEVIVFDGFLRLYIESHDDDHNSSGNAASSKEALLPNMKISEPVDAIEILATERFTQRPSRYSEASLVKKLEELGIGRPSTYAPTISTVINRGYVVKEDREGVQREYRVMSLNAKGEIAIQTKIENVGVEKNKLFPTDIGMVVTDFLQQHFPVILDYNFTASVEKEFDEIAEGELGWQKMLGAFYGPFHKSVEEAQSNSEYVKSERMLGVDPATGKNVYARVGRFGPMVQLGEAEEISGEKPKFAGLQKGQLVATITLEEALSLFSLPRSLGEFEGKEVVVSLGRFGPFVRHDSKFTSLGKQDDPYTITLERAIELILAKRQADIDKYINKFGDIEIINGRWGAYISYNDHNFKIAKTIDPKTLTEQDCREIIEQGLKDGSAKISRSAKSAKTSAATKAATAKKTTKTTASKTKKTTTKTTKKASAKE